jgi:hypothetical protein
MYYLWMSQNVFIVPDVFLKFFLLLVHVLRYFSESCEHILSNLFCTGFEVFTAVTVSSSLVGCNLV